MMNTPKISRVKLGLLAVCLSPAAFGQSPKALQDKLIAEYAITTATADNTDIVTAGCVLTLKKRGLTASPSTGKVPAANYFKDGDPQIRSGAVSGAMKQVKKFGSIGSFVPGGSMIGAAGSQTGDPRVFVNGEKIFVTKIDVTSAKDKDLIALELLSDAYKEVRYRALLRFEFAPGTLATADLAAVQPILDQAIALTPAAADSGAAPQTSQAGPAPAAPVAAVAPPAPVAAPAAPPASSLAEIPPPPPPPAEPQSIENGMTKEQVVAIMGQPVSTVKAGKKEIYTYKGLKVIFTDGKMTDAQ